jgi:hypothetical protein
MNVSDPQINVSNEEMRDMCRLAATGLLEHFKPGPAWINDDAVYIAVDFRVEAQDDTRSRFEVAMLALFERRKDSERFDACSMVKRDGSYGLTVRYGLPNFSARFFPKHERLGFFHAMAVREVSSTIASQCSSEHGIALEKQFRDPRTPFERAIRASIGQYGAIPWKSESERGEMSRRMRGMRI